MGSLLRQMTLMQRNACLVCFGVPILAKWVSTGIKLLWTQDRPLKQMMQTPEQLSSTVFLKLSYTQQFSAVKQHKTPFPYQSSVTSGVR